MNNVSRMLRWCRSANWLHFLLILVPCAYYCGIRHDVDLDDVFIYFRIVDNFLEVGRPEFNPGDHCFMATSPLWTFMLAGAKAALPMLAVDEIGKILWLVLQSLASVMAFLALRPYVKGWAVFISLPILLSDVNSMIGNEIALLYVAFFGTLWALFTRRPVVAGIFLGIGYLARGEFVCMFLVVVTHYLIRVRPNADAGGASGMKREIMRIAVAAFLITSLWHAYSLTVFGHVFPSTLRAKMVQGSASGFNAYLDEMWKYARMLGLHGHPKLLILVAVGIVRFPYLALLVAVYHLSHSLLYAALRVPAYHWYYYDSYLALLLFLFFGLFALGDLARVLLDRGIQLTPLKSTRRVVEPVAAILAVMAFAVWFAPIRIRIIQRRSVTDVWRNTLQSERHATYATLADYLRTRLRDQEIVIAPEVGIIGYHLRGKTVRDTNGLATPGLTSDQVNNCHYLMNRFRPRFVVVPLRTDEDMQFYQWGDQASYYRLRFVASPAAREYVGNLFEREEIPALLRTLRETGRLSPDLRFTLIDGEPALFCQPPFEAELPAAGTLRGLTMEVGFSPKVRGSYLKAMERCNGIDIIISGLSPKEGATELARYHLDPFEGSARSAPLRIAIEVPPGFSGIRLWLEPIDGNNAFDWIYVKGLSLR